MTKLQKFMLIRVNRENTYTFMLIKSAKYAYKLIKYAHNIAI